VKIAVQTDRALIQAAAPSTRYALVSLAAPQTVRTLTGYIDGDYGGRDGYGFETRLVNGVKIAGHRGALAGSSNQVEFYPDLGYVLVILGNTDSGTEAIAAHARALLTSAAPS
jgi:hypothetical protein